MRYVAGRSSMLLLGTDEERVAGAGVSAFHIEGHVAGAGFSAGPIILKIRQFLLSLLRPSTLGIFGFAFQVSTRRAEKQNLSLPRKNASKQ